MSNPAEIRRHHAARLTTKVIRDDARRELKTWIDGMDEKEADELLDRIYEAAGDEIASTLGEPEFEADMDDQIPAFGVEEEA